MERKKNIRYLLILVVWLLCLIPQTAHSNFNRKIYDYYINGNMAAWKSEIIKLENGLQNNIDSKFELINCYYGYTGYLVSENEDDQAAEYIEKAEILLESILQHSPNNATAFAYKGSFIGIQIGMNKFKTISLGPKSIEYIEKSLSLDPNNAQGFLEKGNASYFTPSMFGGSKTEAIMYYKKAISAFEKTNDAEGNWIYLNALTQLALAYEKTEQYEKAGITYKKILRIEPGFKWVRDELYPAFKNKI